MTIIAFSQNNNSIPEGIVYKKSSDDINEQAKKLLLNELKNPTYTLFDKLLYCGPNFWAHYRNDPKIGSIEKGNIDFQVPQPDGRIIVKNGKLIQSSNDFKIVWDKIAIDFNSHNLTIRKLNTSELKYYWSIIFFDIEEPVYVINSNSTTIIIDLSLDGMIQFIEIYKK